MLAHLSDCATCREEVAALQRLRSLLTDTGRQAGVLPADLTSRLAAIAEADDDPDQSRTVRLRTVSLAGMAVLLVLITGVGYLAAPPERDGIADPTAAVRADFSNAVSQLPLTSPAVAAALAADPRRLGAGDTDPDTDIDPDPTMTGPALDRQRIVELLQRAEWASARVSYSGIQRVIAPRDDRTSAADVSIDFAPTTGSRVVVRSLTGTAVIGGTLPTPAASRIAANDLISALAARFRLTGDSGGTVLGRPVIRVQAWQRDPALTQPESVWWIDSATGLVLRQQLYDQTGRLVLAARYTRLAIEPAGPSSPTVRNLLAGPTPAALLTRPTTTATFTTASAGELSHQGWFCQAELAGMQLVRLRADAPAEPGVLHMVYTDGLSTVSVFERRGRLTDPPSASAWDPTLAAYRADAMVNTATWQSGTDVFTVATDGPTGLRDKVVAALPHDPDAGRTTMGRIRAGWSRVLHALG
ncbi:hypothetical protein GCM10011575_01760 [Microlunatus endophyticus]|uniref:Uncharacterized protein n=1 Tax=Microlunatus endophyticus TaxID=1716077 RepID=A0A917RZT1_9ACTN|nr:hypothetical protein GCM10011575_01760 [Microlunatus endophyticus]